MKKANLKIITRIRDIVLDAQFIQLLRMANEGKGDEEFLTSLEYIQDALDKIEQDLGINLFPE